MYKKVTHYIVEEHFDHPALAAMACNVAPAMGNVTPLTGNVMYGGDSWYGNTQPKLSSIGSKLKMVNFDPVALLLIKIYSQWRDYVMYNEELVDSVVNKIDNVTLIEDRLAGITKGISDTFAEYYGRDVSDTVYKMLTKFNEIVIEIIKAENNTGITAGQQELANAAISTLTDYLHSINPNNWFKDPLNYQFMTYLAAMNDKIKSSVKKDWAADIAADERINQIIGNLSESILKGIVEQFRPSFFPAGQ